MGILKFKTLLMGIKLPVLVLAFRVIDGGDNSEAIVTSSGRMIGDGGKERLFSGYFQSKWMWLASSSYIRINAGKCPTMSRRISQDNLLPIFYLQAGGFPAFFSAQV